MTGRVVLDGTSLDVVTLVSLSRLVDRAHIEVGVVEEATRAATAMVSVPAYGRTTGVGANRELIVDAADRGHALRLWMSHAAGSGPLIDEEAVRAMLLVRLNQVCTGRTGVSPDCGQALRMAVDADALPAVHRFGGVGTGDLTGPRRARSVPRRAPALVEGRRGATRTHRADDRRRSRPAVEQRPDRRPRRTGLR